MSRKGECLEHVVAERFFGSIKGERISLHYYATCQEAWDDVIDDIELLYDSKRWHSYPGYISPNDFEGSAEAA